MYLYNRTQKKLITNKLKIAKTFSENLFGFITEKENDAILFKTRFGIHTFLMKEPITVLVLNNTNKVTKIKILKPNNLFFWNPKYNKIIELKNNKTNSKTGDQLEII